MSLTQLFCDVDDFCQQFLPAFEQQQISSHERRRIRKSRLSVSEVMTIIIHFHQSSYRNFKSYYVDHVWIHLKSDFPNLVSYNQFLDLKKSVLMPLCAYLNQRKGHCTGISYVDSTPIAVCHNRRIHRHKTFEGLAARGKSSMGWFYGFKLHLIVNEYGELLSFTVTPGNTNDRTPVEKMCKGLSGKLFGDKGYISKKLFQQLIEQGLRLFTNLRKNMRQQLITFSDKLLLRKRFIFETINDQLKNISQIEHTRHRSVVNFMTNMLAGLIAYTWQEKKPSINWNKKQEKLIQAI